MTPMTKRIQRVLVDPLMNRVWVVEMDRAGIHFREKGCRKRVTIGWGKALSTAFHMEAQAQLKERNEKRRQLAGRGLIRGK